MQDYIEIIGARENNLQNVSLKLPRHTLIVFTGVSGSGKSSLAFDTLYKEGQRRFIESLSPYARQFLGEMEKPKVDHIEGISPTVCIDQKRRGASSRSTVGTITAVYDYLRLLFARLGTPHCPHCLVPVTKQSTDQIVRFVMARYEGRQVNILAPMVVERKGEYRKELAQWKADGFMRLRVDGQIQRLDEEIRLSRYEKHTLELVLDRLLIAQTARTRLAEAVGQASKTGSGVMAIVTEQGEYEMFSVSRACPYCGFSIPELEPRLFSFNSPEGACPTCDGSGEYEEFEPKFIVPDPTLAIDNGALQCLNKDGNVLFSRWGMQDLEALAHAHEVSLSTPWQDLPVEFQNAVIQGTGETGQPKRRQRAYFPGIIPIMQTLFDKWNLHHLRRFLNIYPCPDCQGSRLRQESRHVLFRNLNIGDLSGMRIGEFLEFVRNIRLEPGETIVGEEIVQELVGRLSFLNELGLSYLTLDRHGNTLAGGEMQRIRLARQLGAGLQGVLYILDEPSIGLHARDNKKLLAALAGLRDQGNTVVVIEHDEETMLTADHLVDMGPGAGNAGGQVVAQGTAWEVAKTPESLTGQYLTCQKQIHVPTQRRKPGNAWLTVVGASQHNLQQVEAHFPLGLLVVVTGVSGSGKSTLVDDVLYRALARHLYQSSELPGKHEAILGMDNVNKVIEVDQSPIGRTPRSNPATYTKIFDEIRDLFCLLPESRARGYAPGRFSFNVAGGRCETCQGLGYKEIEMQFLPSVWIPCQECEGRRFNRETLEIQYRGKSIADILDMSVSDALLFFEHHSKLQRALATLVQVGMGYIKLGQPSPTLSGGEAQRIKLVRELQSKGTGNTLYILDEPTTGLHFADIENLITALQQLVSQGNTVLLIEHNMEIIKIADWIIDLGPEGGADGGQIIFCGPPEPLLECERSYTGRALREYFALRKNGLPQNWTKATVSAGNHGRDIVLRGATKHNLKNLTATIPWQQMTVVTGVSGSGKSSLVFDTLFAEGQRMFLESLSTYARRFLGRLDKGDVDSAEGLAPTIAIDQKSASVNPRSTVATMTEIYDYLRILYAKIGIPHCPDCGKRLYAYTPSSAAAQLVKIAPAGDGMVLAPLYLPGTRKKFALENSSSLKEYAGYLNEMGFSRLLIAGEMVRLDSLPKTIGRKPIHLVLDRINLEAKADAKNLTRLAESLETAFHEGHGVALFHTGQGKEPPLAFTTIPACLGCDYYQYEELHPRMFSFNHYLGACPQCDGLGERAEEICTACQGKRLKPEYAAVTIGNTSLPDLCAKTIVEAQAFFAGLTLDAQERMIAEEAIKEITSRLKFLQDVGLDYLTLERRGHTLSGGEAQRIRLATQIGNRLVGVIYVLDEPTVGLHPRDTALMIKTLQNLVTRGNTVVMVEHDPICIRHADHLIDMGPGAGHGGGQIIACGCPQDVAQDPRSLTGQYLSGQFVVQIPKASKTADAVITIANACLHNLKNITVSFPVGQFTVVTGVSGSGKSSLVVEVLQKAAGEYFENSGDHGVVTGKSGYGQVSGLDNVCRVSVVDQTPLARSTHSNVATYAELFTPIRDLFATLPGARARGFSAARFSFNRSGGRCEVCEGQGVIQVQMHFLSDVWVTCEACHGKRYLEETLAVRYHDKNIAQVLEMDVVEARELFSAHSVITRKLKVLEELGLGYIQLGQLTTTMSGGEAQRLKLAKELLASKIAKTLCIMDEPTTGLHPADIQKLLEVIARLRREGHTVIVIEHNIDVIRSADFVVDLGPEGGDKGGEVVFAGSPERLAQCQGSYTGQALNTRNVKSC